MNKKYRLLWFIIGLGAQLQILFSLSISETMIFCLAPFFIAEEFHAMRRSGVITCFYVSILPLLGCILACVVNGTALVYALRGLATTALIPCVVIVVHRLFRKDMNGYKWYFVGELGSLFISTYVFQHYGMLQTYAGGQTGLDAAEALMSSPLYWIQRFGGLLLLPSRGWYCNVPLAYSVLAPVFLAIFSLKTSASGRSTALGVILAALMVMIAGKRRASIKRVAKYFWVVVICGVCSVFVLNVAYKKAALSGWMGEESRQKYERQTRGGDSILNLLIGGRAASFVGLLAVADKPVFGFGPWAVDDAGYLETFFSRYASVEDYEDLLGANIRQQRRLLLIECHACWLEFWVWYGLLGMVFWLYVLFVVFRFLRHDCWVVPQWFFWLGAGAPGVLWMIFFSPYTTRVMTPMMLVGYLMARAVRHGRVCMPVEMIKEIDATERGR